MLPSSDALESYVGELRAIDKALSKLTGDAKVIRDDHLSALKARAKDWIRISSGLRGVEGIDPDVLNACDAAMAEVLNLANARSRASAYRARLETVLAATTDGILVPLVRYEGSPAQGAARFIASVFDGVVDEEEAEYIGEAARCVTVRSYRAALIMLWTAAVARMHKSVLGLGFERFNAAVTVTAGKKGSPFNRVATKIGNVQGLPELQNVRDFDLIVFGIELWSYDMPVFEELQRLLGQRNNAAHPGMLNTDVYDVQHYAQKLRKSVFDIIKPAKAAAD